MNNRNQQSEFLENSLLNNAQFKNMTDAEKLKEIRGILKMTQSKFAFKIKVSRESLAQVEAGNNNISINMEYKINKALFFDKLFNYNISDDENKINNDLEKVTDQYCIDFLKKTGKYKILKIDYTEI